MKKIYETERLIIRQFLLSDAEDLYEYVSDAETTKFMTFPTYTNIEQAYDRMRDRIALYEKQGDSHGTDADWAVVEKKRGKLIGSIGFSLWDIENHVAEFGYVFNKKFHGKGYGTEALKGLLDYMRRNAEEFGIYKIIGKCDVLNLPSARVMEKSGMTFVGIEEGICNNNLRQNAPAKRYEINLR